eukprot:4794383-Amphidinium_carterae.1
MDTKALKAAMARATDTSGGCDCWSPAELQHAPQEAYRDFARHAEAWERLGAAPTVLTKVRQRNLAKPGKVQKHSGELDATHTRPITVLSVQESGVQSSRRLSTTTLEVCQGDQRQKSTQLTLHNFGAARTPHFAAMDF